MITRFLTNSLNFLNTFLSSKPILFGLVFRFFDFSTKFTGFLFQHTLGFILFHSSIIFAVFYYGPEVSCFFRLIQLNGVSMEVFVVAWKDCFSFGFKIFICIYYFLFDFIVFNIFLTYFDCLTLRLKEIYGSDVLKIRGYNSKPASLIKYTASVGGLVAAYGGYLCADVAKTDIYMRGQVDGEKFELKQEVVKLTEKTAALQTDLARVEMERNLLREEASRNAGKKTWFSTKVTQTNNSTNS